MLVPRVSPLSFVVLRTAQSLRRDLCRQMRFELVEKEFRDGTGSTVKTMSKREDERRSLRGKLAWGSQGGKLG